ncbi:hypothetical protein GCM10010282_62310 [Streptomyces roseolus]|nr:hypothetical protein GCM10010282_62310 [Streptomyces roseolus]
MVESGQRRERRPRSVSAVSEVIDVVINGGGGAGLWNICIPATAEGVSSMGRRRVCDERVTPVRCLCDSGAGRTVGTPGAGGFSGCGAAPGGAALSDWPYPGRGNPAPSGPSAVVVPSARAARGRCCGSPVRTDVGGEPFVANDGPPPRGRRRTVPVETTEAEDRGERAREPIAPHVEVARRARDEGRWDPSREGEGEGEGDRVAGRAAEVDADGLRGTRRGRGGAPASLAGRSRHRRHRRRPAEGFVSGGR